MNAEAIKRELDKSWSYEEAQAAREEIEAFNRRGFWNAPAWAHQIYGAYGVVDPKLAFWVAQDRIHAAYAARIQELEGVIRDLCESQLQTKEEIQEETGLSDSRCHEIAAVVKGIL